MPHPSWLIRLAVTLWLATGPALLQAQSFDHGHAAWTVLLKSHVKPVAQGRASRVDYAGFMRDRATLSSYLQSLSAVTPAQYAGWSRAEQYAFLANAYNAFTIEKILTRYPDLKSIRDLGSLFASPWKERFVDLLGKRRSLDEIEHEMLRAPGVFDEPRVHVTVNCASIGCPLLADRAFTATGLDEQLEDLMRRFMSDRSRNRFDAASGTLLLSRIFDWYKADFQRPAQSFLGYRGFTGLHQVAARYADQLADDPAARDALRSGKPPAIRFLEYDWALNDTR